MKALIPCFKTRNKTEQAVARSLVENSKRKSTFEPLTELLANLRVSNGSLYVE